jgi:signal transduction histidine kinase
MHHLDVQRASLSAVLAAQVQDQDARERALLQDERARIARELHDVVAHAVSVMVVQAGAARLAVGLDDDEAREGLRAVEVTGREALLDLRRLLSLLRPDDDGSTQPAPGLALLGPLVDRMRAAGLDVRLTVSGALRPLHAGLDLAAYRIVQEALTNVLKHAGSPNAAVELEYGDSLTLRITDPGPRTGGRGTRGQGVIGMRERAAVFGGTFAAGPHAEGWRVTATLPVPATDSAEAQP